ncbi:hypothetical protein [Saccharospirillum mangrovi]|uniref:hypothetical protein n=1 Tax=Saccharospirillum mangrovi TaxID=2161747 RepID=UPI000D3B38A3|nr:hypothetical protein [Saccharospirillum mangrovi]
MTFKLFKRSALALAISGSAVAPLVAKADTVLDTATPVFTVRTATTGFTISGFDVQALPNGDVAVVWTESNTATGQLDRLLLRTFDQQGFPTSNVVVLDQEDASIAERFQSPSVATAQDGTLVIGWELAKSAQTSQRCGNPGDDLRVVRVIPPYTGLSTFSLQMPSSLGTSPCAVQVEIDNDGDFLVSWADELPGEVYNLNIMTFVANTIQASSARTVVESAEEIGSWAMQDNGTLLLGWLRDGDAIGQRYDFQLNRFGSEVELDAGFSQGSARFLQVETDADDGFVAFWAQQATANVQRWKSDLSQGEALELESLANDGSISSDRPSLAADSDGNLLAAWTLNRTGTSEQQVFVGSFDAANEAIDDVAELDEPGSNTGVRVALNDEVGAAVWLASSTRLDAHIIAPLLGRSIIESEKSSPEDNSTDNAPPDAGSVGWLGILMSLVLAGARRLRRA